MVNQKLKDFETLKNLMNLKIKLNEIDDATKQRLIDLCKEQIDSVNQQIEGVRNKRKQLEENLLKIKKGN